MNEMELRKKMLEELMGQMDERQMGRVQPSGAPAMDPRMMGERGNMTEPDADEFGGAGDGDEDELTRRLRQASMSR